MTNTKHMDTLLAYRNYLQIYFRRRLNSVSLASGEYPCHIALLLFGISAAFLVVGVLLITLREHHLYLVGIWPSFTGPLFIVIFMTLFGTGVQMTIIAKRRSNRYRRNLVNPNFKTTIQIQPVGQFGVKYVPKSHLPHERVLREEFRSGTTPHKPRGPRPRGYRMYQFAPYPQRSGYASGYEQGENGEPRESRDRPPHKHREPRNGRDPRDEREPRGRREPREHRDYPKGDDHGNDRGRHEYEHREPPRGPSRRPPPDNRYADKYADDAPPRYTREVEQPVVVPGHPHRQYEPRSLRLSSEDPQDSAV